MRPIIYARPKTAPLSAQPARSWPWQLAAPLVLTLVGIAVYANSFDDPFVFDSLSHIPGNPSLRQLWPWNFSLEQPRHVGYFSVAINDRGNGYNFWGYHAVDLAIQVAAAWLLFGIVRRTLSRGWLAARYGDHAWGLALAIALVWLVHPLQTGSVTYVYQRLESLMGLFYLATLWCFLSGLDSPRRTCWFATSVVCCALGMGTKETMVTAPLIVLWYDRAFYAQSWRELFHERGRYYAALAATWGILAGLMLSQAENYPKSGVFVVKGVSPLQYALSQPGVIRHYLRLSFWPDQLCLDYCWPVATTARQILPPALIVGALLLLTLWAMYRWPAWGFVGGWFFLILAPTSSVAPLADLAFEHRMYLPLAAVVTLVVILGYDVWHYFVTRWTSLQPNPWHLANVAPRAALLTIVAILGWRTVLRNDDYRTPLAIWQDTVRKSPDNARAHNDLANALIVKKDFVGAFDEASRAIELDPDFALARDNRGLLYRQRGEYELALEDYRRAIAIDPTFAAAYFNRGKVLDALGHVQEAVDDYSRAIDLDDQSTEAYNNRGVAYGRLDRFDLAIKDLSRAIELDPKLAAAYANRALAYYKLGRVDLALRDVRISARLGIPPSPEFLRQLRAATANGPRGGPPAKPTRP